MENDNKMNSYKSSYRQYMMNRLVKKEMDIVIKKKEKKSLTAAAK